MLTMTQTAATTLTRVRSEKGAPSDYGVRFFATTDPSSDQARLAFTFVGTPKPDDTVLKDSVIDAYVAPEVDEAIGDVIVDTDEDKRMGLVVKRPQRG